MASINRLFIYFLSFIFIVCHVNGQQAAKKIPYPLSPDKIIGFLEFKPADYDSNTHPLIIFLHGSGERGNGSSDLKNVAANGIPLYCANGASMKFTSNGKSSSFVVLSPQLSKQYGAWELFYITEMIKYAKANLNIDTNRIYITGISLGGGGVWGAITESEELCNEFAAAAPVCGTQEMKDNNFCASIGKSHLPVWAFHSADDQVVGIQATQHGEILGSMCKLAPPLKITYYKSGGHSQAWVNAYDTGHISVKLMSGKMFTAKPNLYEWFLQHKRGVSANKRVMATKKDRP